MDEQPLIWLYVVGVCTLSVISMVMWYFYGAIDSINDDGNTSQSPQTKLSHYVDSYHTNLIVCVLLYSFVTIACALTSSIGWIVLVAQLVLFVLAKHQGYAKGMALNSAASALARLCYTIASPVVMVLSLLIHTLARGLHLNIEDAYERVTEEEIISMVNDGQQQGVLEKEEAEMISNIVELGDKEAMDIMTHRKNVVAISEDATLGDVFELLMKEKYSRYPVYREDLDHIVGILHFRDFFRHYHEEGLSSDKTLREASHLLRDAYFVPATKNVNDIFRQMQEEKTHMAIVIDEYGQLDGILAMEDIIEEIMGNILDEYDDDETMLIEQEGGKYLARGSCQLTELSHVLGIDFGDDYETLSGFLIHRLNRIPTAEDNNRIDLTYDGYVFRIVTIKHKVIQLVRIRPINETDKGEQ